MRPGTALAVLILATGAGGTALAEGGSIFRPTPLPGDGSPAKSPSAPKADESASCAADVSVHEGIVKLSVLDAARAGNRTTFKLDGLTYASHFDSAGRLDAEAPMFHAKADLAWTGRGGQDCAHAGMSFDGVQSSYFVALIWSDPDVRLALHVIEPPNGRLGGARNYVFPGRPNADGASAFGRMQVFGEPVVGTVQVELYTLPADRNAHDGVVYAFVEFASRGNPAVDPFCGSDPHAVAVFSLFHRDGDAMAGFKSRFGSVECGMSWAGDLVTSGYYQGPWKWKM